MTPEEGFDLINSEDATIASAVATARTDICRAVVAIAEQLERGGRLIYVGAGTSGRLGVLDAVECPPTFLSDPAIVQGVIAGGREAMFRSIERAEDRREDGAAAVDELRVGSLDVVFGIATGGTTPFVHGALARARALGARTVFFACIPRDQVADDADISIRVLTGPEVLTGSTRMKAGTATKMVLNTITTLVMVRLGKVYQNLMVDVNTSANRKLVDRGARILMELTGLARGESTSLLERAGGRVKTALVMHRLSLSREVAEQRLAEAGGKISIIVDQPVDPAR